MYSQIKKVFRYYLPEIGKYRWQLSLAVLSYVTYIIIQNSFIPVRMKNIVDAIQAKASPLAWKELLLLALSYAVAHLLLFVTLRLVYSAEARMARDLYELAYQNFMKHSYRFYVENFTGALTNKLERLGRNVTELIDAFFFAFLSITVSVLASLFVLFRESPSFAAITILFILAYVTATHYANRKIAPVYEERSRASSRFTAYLADVFTNIHTVIALGARSFEKRFFRKENENYFQKMKKIYHYESILYEALSLIPTLFLILLIAYAIYLVEQGTLSIGSIVLVFMVSRNVVFKVWRIGNVAQRFTRIISDTKEAIEIIEQQIEVEDTESPERVQIERGDVRFENVSFRYPNGEQVFTNFSLHIPAGQSIGIVGNSGSGKTTLVKLLLRLYDVQDGRITIDEQDIRRIPQEELRRKIAYIPQETILFHRSIEENIRYGLDGVPSEKVQEIAKKSYVDEFVRKMEKGYETEVGERGVKLSGGQRQRIGIARAMLREDAPILILDEATSSLDSLSEQYIQKAFDELAKNRTTIVIAHRLSTIQKVDRIIVMDKGEIIEDGTHSELLAKNGKYAELWNSQVGGFLQEE